MATASAGSLDLCQVTEWLLVTTGSPKFGSVTPGSRCEFPKNPVGERALRREKTTPVGQLMALLAPVYGLCLGSCPGVIICGSSVSCSFEDTAAPGSPGAGERPLGFRSGALAASSPAPASSEPSACRQSGWLAGGRGLRGWVLSSCRRTQRYVSDGSVPTSSLRRNLDTAPCLHHSYLMDSFVDHDGYSISSEGFLPTVYFLQFKSEFGNKQFMI